MALALDPSSGLPLDPATLQAIQQQQLSQGIAQTGGNSRERMNDMTVARGVNTMFPNLAMRQANAAQQAIGGLNLTQNDGESDIDFSLRQLHATRDAVSNIDPHAAAAMNQQILKLGEMKFQQDHLRAQDQREQANFNAGAGARALEGATGGFGYLVKTNQQGEVLSSQVFDATNPSDTQAMQDAMKKDPSLRLFSGKDMATLTRSQDSGDRKLAQQLLIQQMRDKAGMLPDGTQGQYYLDTLINPNLMSRMSTPAKAQIAQVELKAGISAAEKAGTIAEYKGMMAAVGNAAKREANITMFGNELQQQQSVLLAAANDVDRGRVALINKLWANGQTYGGSNPKEAAYAAALQTYVNTYARVVGGSQGVVSDNARKEALSAVSGGYLSPAGMKGATDMLSQNEVNIIKRASDDTVELFTNPDRYKRLISVQDKLRRAGYAVANTTTEDSGDTVRSPPAAPPAATRTYDPASGTFK